MQDRTTAAGVGLGGLPGPVTVLGTAVVVTGDGADGAPELALWQVDTEGVATGAWILAQEEAFGHTVAARRLLSCITGRAVTGRDLSVVEAVLVRLAAVAGLRIDASWWPPLSFSPIDAFQEVLERRAAYENSILAKRATSKNVVPLEWRRDFSRDDRPVDVDGLRSISNLAVPVGAPVASNALVMSRLLRWIVELWSETEQAKNRRTYLQEEHGPPEDLPPSWLNALRTAQSMWLPL